MSKIAVGVGGLCCGAAVLVGCWLANSPAQAVLATGEAAPSQPEAGAQELLTKARVVLGRLPDRMFGNEEDTPAMIELGRRLFYEKALSLEHNQSCYTCHPIDGNRPGTRNQMMEVPAHGKPIARDAPTVLDAGYQAAEFWDGRAADLAAQARMPLFNPVEMAMPNERVCLERIRELPFAAMFQQVFADSDPITMANTVRAIAAFEHTLVSRGRFDDYMAGDEEALTAQEKQGLGLFLKLGCASCHNSPSVGGNLFNRVGIFRPYPNAHDLGRYTLTKREFDRYVFKVPSLRNVTLTSPYFHDGQVTTLAEAVDLMAWMQLDRKLSDPEIDLLLRFLTTLADKPRTTAPPPHQARPTWTSPNLADIPNDEQGKLIRRGHELLYRTYSELGPGAERPELRYDGSGQSCRHCHPNDGTKPYGIPWVGVTHRYPHQNNRTGKMAILEDRINDCFERSLNGRALPVDGPEMRAIMAYMAWLSRGVEGTIPGIYSTEIQPPDRAADLEAGRAVYQQYCQTCHGPQGDGYRSKSAGPPGEHVTPPLWGDQSYNNGAGMARVLTAAGFIKANMPLGTRWDRPVLTDEQAFDVAAYINAQPRPIRADLDKDYPDRTKKPIDCPYPPYADDFPQSQHQFGPFPPIRKAREQKRP